jgi:hypothetical protein
MESLLICTQLLHSPVDQDEVHLGQLLTLVAALSLLVVTHLAMMLVAA